MDKSKFYTPHIKATPEDFAKTVLMPGDPLRAKFIAENYLDGAVLVNSVRGINGYTGTYKGQRVSVMASGMGMPSIGIYSYELYNFFGVENIIRVGSLGGMQEKVKLRDIIFGISASTTSNFAVQYELEGSFAPTASFDLLRVALEEADKLGASYHVGNILSSDIFYNANAKANEKWVKMGTLGVEMEAAALYMNAAHANRRALAICTVSDHLLTGESLDSDARQESFTEMMEIALNTAIRL
jgi:purine-nucleoside phosphorylase